MSALHANTPPFPQLLYPNVSKEQPKTIPFSPEWTYQQFPIKSLKQNALGSKSINGTLMRIHVLRHTCPLMHTYVVRYIHSHTCTQTHMHAHAHTGTLRHMPIHAYTCSQTHSTDTCAQAHLCTHTDVYTHTDIHIYSGMHTWRTGTGRR